MPLAGSIIKSLLDISQCLKLVQGEAHLYNCLLHKRSPAEFTQLGLIGVRQAPLRKAFSDNLRVLLSDDWADKWETLNKVVLIHLLQVAVAQPSQHNLKEYFEFASKWL